MPPAEGLGCRYLLATVFEAAPLLSIVKVVPLAANQTFIYDDTEYTSPRAREVFVFEGYSSQLVEIAGHDPLLVAQFLRAETKPKVLDVVMVLPVPEHLWGTSYRVYVPPEPTQSQDSFYLFLVVQAGDEEFLTMPGFSVSCALNYLSSCHRIFGLVVQASASRAADLASIPTFSADLIPLSSHTSDLNIGTPLATLAFQAPGVIGSALGLVGRV